LLKGKGGDAPADLELPGKGCVTKEEWMRLVSLFFSSTIYGRVRIRIISVHGIDWDYQKAACLRLRDYKTFCRTVVRAQELICINS